MLSTLLQGCIVIVMQIKLTVVVVLNSDLRTGKGRTEPKTAANEASCHVMSLRMNRKV